jgi:hypothetical protein
MRLPIVIALALVATLAGCTALQGKAGEPVSPASTQTTHATTPPTATTTPPPGTTTSTPPPQTTTTTPTNPSPPPPPPKPADYHGNKSGFVNVTPGEAFVAKLGFPVQARALNVTAHVSLTTETPAGLSPVQTDNLTIILLDPDGKELQRAFDVAVVQQETIGMTLSLNATNLTKAGEYTFVVQVTGVSDGATLGQRYLATVDVKY